MLDRPAPKFHGLCKGCPHRDRPFEHRWIGVTGLPAYAGIDLISVVHHILKATPHTRGSTPYPYYYYYHIGGYPAYAGIDLIYRTIDGIEVRLPRIRGDRPYAPSYQQVAALATPHTRGSTLEGVFGLGGSPGYPAYAGIDRN